MSSFFWGFVVGALAIVVILYVLLFDLFGTVSLRTRFIEQFQPLQLPQELRHFLLSGNDGSVNKWESCFNISLILHFLFQEHKDTRRLRRWFHKKLQLELNDLITRSAAGRLIQEIRIQDLCIGSKAPVINGIRVENCDLASDNEGFKMLTLLVDVDYTGGFQTSIDVSIVLGRFAQMSIKVVRLCGKVRVKMSREPFTHWALAFVDQPLMELQIQSHWQGKQLKHLIPLITQQFRRIVQRKHVWPNYKIRYRPFFTNPLYIPSPPLGAFDHIQMTGVLEVIILRCTRLNVPMVSAECPEVFCSLYIDQRPLSHNVTTSSCRSVTVLLNFIRHRFGDPIGMTFTKSISDIGVRAVQIATVESGSYAELSGFKQGDVVIAVNNVPITNERQLCKLLTGTAGELNVLVDRVVYDKSETSVSIQDSIVPRKRSHSASSLDNMNSSKTSINNFDDNNSQTSGDHNASQIIPKLIFDDNSSSTLEVDGVGSQIINPLSINKIEVRRVKSEAELWVEKKSAKRGGMNSFLKGNLFASVESTFKKCSCPTLSVDADNISTKSSLRSNSSLKLSDGSVNGKQGVTEICNSLKVEVPTLTRRERLQARAAEMAAAGKAKVSDFWYRHKEVDATTDVAVDVITQTDGESLTHSRTSSPFHVVSTTKKKKSAHCTKKGKDETSVVDDDTLSKTIVNGTILNTKSLRLSEDVVWGQSLHFQLNEKSKYLNVSVNAKSLVSSGDLDATKKNDDSKELLDVETLGYTSIYVPQLLDDCQLTLSNCHREVFYLRPSSKSIGRRPLAQKMQENSHRAGFDERLCYGDILLGFRFFPNGFPDDVLFGKNIDDPKPVNIDELNQNPFESGHHFESIVLKGWTVCSACKGKVWMKSASHCIKCLMIVHNKCIAKVSNICTKQYLFDDSAFEVLDSTQVDCLETPFPDEILENVAVESLCSSPIEVSATAIEDGDCSSIMPVQNVIPDVFSLLKVPDELFGMMYQPGNAYNEEMIKAAKNVGQKLFAKMDRKQRKQTINKHMEEIQRIITETTAERLCALEQAKAGVKGNENSVTGTGTAFLKLDERLQALAVLMLHYCAALQDSIDGEEKFSNESSVPDSSSNSAVDNNFDSNENFVNQP